MDRVWYLSSLKSSIPSVEYEIFSKFRKLDRNNRRSVRKFTSKLRCTKFSRFCTWWLKSRVCIKWLFPTYSYQVMFVTVYENNNDNDNDDGRDKDNKCDTDTKILMVILIVITVTATEVLVLMEKSKVL